jgi:hypothetical protein
MYTHYKFGQVEHDGAKGLMLFRIIRENRGK